jgi:predicted transcriptional regulator
MQGMKISDFMSRHPVAFTPNESIESAVERLLQTKQRGGPVLDEQRKVIGFLSEQDCLAAMLRDTYHKEQTATVSDCMYRGEVLCVGADEAIADLAQRMEIGKPKIYPVIDMDTKQLVGVISRTDVLGAIDSYFQDSYRRR